MDVVDAIVEAIDPEARFNALVIGPDVEKMNGVDFYNWFCDAAVLANETHARLLFAKTISSSSLSVLEERKEQLAKLGELALAAARDSASKTLAVLLINREIKLDIKRGNFNKFANFSGKYPLSRGWAIILRSETASKIALKVLGGRFQESFFNPISIL